MIDDALVLRVERLRDAVEQLRGEIRSRYRADRPVAAADVRDLAAQLGERWAVEIASREDVLLIDALLNEVAQAMADLVTIYGAANDELPLKPLPWAEVKLGVFQCGATVLRTNDRIDYRGLYIRHYDVRAAATVLKRSGARFASAEALQAARQP